MHHLFCIIKDKVVYKTDRIYFVEIYLMGLYFPRTDSNAGVMPIHSILLLSLLPSSMDTMESKIRNTSSLKTLHFKSGEISHKNK